MRIEYDSNTSTYSVYLSTAADLFTFRETGAGTQATPIWGDNNTFVDVYLEADIDMENENEYPTATTNQIITHFYGQGHKITKLHGNNDNGSYYLFFTENIYDVKLLDINIESSANIYLFIKRNYPTNDQFVTQNIKVTGTLQGNESSGSIAIATNYLMQGTTGTTHCHLIATNCSFNGIMKAYNVCGLAYVGGVNAYSTGHISLINCLIGGTLEGTNVYIFGRAYGDGAYQHGTYHININTFANIQVQANSLYFNYYDGSGNDRYNNVYTYVNIQNAAALIEEHGDNTFVNQDSRNNNLLLIGDTSLLLPNADSITLAEARNIQTFKKLGWPI